MSAVNALIIDQGCQVSVSSSLFVADLMATRTGKEIYFLTRPENQHLAGRFPQIKFLYDANDAEFFCERADWHIDFTEPGKGITENASLLHKTQNLYLTQNHLGKNNLLDMKVDFVSSLTGMRGLLTSVAAGLQSPVLTYSAEMAAALNLQGIPTIELCYKFKKPGSFLPGSLVILGESFAMIQKDELDMVFEFYKNGKIEELFMNKGVLEVDWDLLYFKSDGRDSIHSKRYPVTPMESFLDLFFKGFLTNNESNDFSIDRLLKVSQDMDKIDFEMTVDFVRKSLNLCLEDLDHQGLPLTSSYWNLVRPYLDCSSRKAHHRLRKALNQSLIGLEMFEKIHDRHRKVVSMH